MDSFIAQSDSPLTSVVAGTSTFLTSKTWGNATFTQFATNQMAARKDNSVGCIITARAAGPTQGFTITFPVGIVQGYYLITFNHQAGSSTTNSFAGVLGGTPSNCQVVSWNGIDGAPDQTGSMMPNNVASTGAISFQVVIYVSSPGSLQASLSIGLQNPTVASSQTWATICQVPQKVNY